MSSTVVRGGCSHDCPDSCAWEVTVEDGRAVKLAGDPNHPYTRGTLCAKVNRYLDRVYSPDRVLHPLRRVGGKGEGRRVEEHPPGSRAEPGHAALSSRQKRRK